MEPVGNWIPVPTRKNGSTYLNPNLKSTSLSELLVFELQRYLLLNILERFIKTFLAVSCHGVP